MGAVPHVHTQKGLNGIERFGKWVCALGEGRQSWGCSGGVSTTIGPYERLCDCPEYVNDP